MPNTIAPADAVFGGEVGLFLGAQTNASPLVGINPATSGNFVAPPTSMGLATAGFFIPAGFVDVPAINNTVSQDMIYPLGTYVRQQANTMDYTPSLSIAQDVQDLSLLASALRDGNGHLTSYSMLFGNSSLARYALGAKCETMEINIPRQGRVTATGTYQALIIAPVTVTPPAMSFINDYASPVFYGRDLSLVYGTTDISQLVRNVRIRITHHLERLPPVFYAVGGSQTTQLVSSLIKETTQEVSVTFDLYKPIIGSAINDICQSTLSLTALLSDNCTAGRLIRFSVADLKFSADSLQAGQTQSILQFSAEASAQTIVIATT